MRKLPIISISLALLGAAILLFAFHFSSFSSPPFARGTLSKGPVWKTKNFKPVLVYFNGKSSELSIDKISEKFTFRGSLSLNNEWKIYPKLKGNYMMDFLVFSNKETGGYLSIIRKGMPRPRIIYLKVLKSFMLKRFRIPVNLSKKDTLILHFWKGRDIIVSDPVFCRRTKALGKLVFIIVADTLRKDRLGVYNPTKECSPNIDQFSKDSVVFTRAYATAPWTLPSHVSLFTGLYSTRHGVNQPDKQIPDRIKSLFLFLRKKFLLYSHNGDFFVSSRFGFSRGFDLYSEIKDDPRNRNSAQNMFRWAMKQLEGEEYNSNELFFLHTYQVHSPYKPEFELAKKYYEISGNPNLREFTFNIKRIIGSSGNNRYNKNVEEKEKKKIIAIYEAGVYTFDHYFGEFVKFLKQRHLYSNSMIILLADHGEEFGDHGGWEHGHSLYEELINIPLIIKFPQNRYAGKRVHSIVSTTDILPAIIDYYHVKLHLPYKLDGISLLKTLNSKSNNNSRIIISYLAPYAVNGGVPMKIALVTENLKLIFNQKMSQKDLNFFLSPPRFDKYELYDLKKDPEERHNLFGKWRYKARVKKLIRILKLVEFKEGKNLHLSSHFLKELKSLGYVH